MIVGKMNEVALDLRQSKDIRVETMSALSKMSAISPNIFKQTTLSNFVESLPVELSEDEERRQEQLGILSSPLTKFGPYLLCAIFSA